MNISQAKVIIATHYLVYGAPQALREYLMQKRVGRLLFIAHPLEIDETRGYAEVIEGNTIRKKKIWRRQSPVSIIKYACEVWRTIATVMLAKDAWDVFFGVDCLNCCAGLLLRMIGNVRRVIYYTIDYSPRRFANPLLNRAYHWCDQWCLAHADETWNVSPRIAEGRERHSGLTASTYPEQRVVPIGVWPKGAESMKRKKHQLVFVGHLLEKQGIQLALDALPAIRTRIPDVHFLVIGGGGYLPTLQEKARQLGVETYVTFTGWVKDPARADALLSESSVAVALYDRSKDTFTQYADATKLKEYLANGLPIILTDVPFNAQDIEQHGCGMVVPYEVSAVASAVVEIMNDERRLQEYRNRARMYIRQFYWESIFNKEFQRL